MTTVAAIDCGTNSIRLLIADVVAGSDGPQLVDAVREMRVVRLGAGVDQTKRLDPAAIERTRLALSDYVRAIRDHNVTSVRMVATSATRDAINRSDFESMVVATLGASAEVITGNEEARLSFTGAVGSLTDVQAPFLVTDIGGGSTELVRGDRSSLRGSGALSAYSMDVGCVRLTERHIRSDPPSEDQIAAVVADTRAALEIAGQTVALHNTGTLIGVAGTVTTVVAIVRGLQTYDPDQIHGVTVSLDDVREVTSMLLSMTRAQRAEIPVMHPGRVDVIGSGALILRTIMEATGSSTVTASEHDILDGIALSISG
jgi:exopolyphosphatase/guanosine-5'-triphosphate,3'-diphosphate pyrophosphatase